MLMENWHLFAFYCFGFFSLLLAIDLASMIMQNFINSLNLREGSLYQ